MSGKVRDPNTPRNKARAAGEVTFDPGHPCKHGHVSRFRTASGGCIECQRLQDNAPERRVKRQRYAQSDRGKAWRKKWYAENSGKCIGYCIERYYGQDDRFIPPEHKPLVAAIYAQARAEGKVVDHIIPFRGKWVSGLHTLANLQVITQEENLRKLNYTDTDNNFDSTDNTHG
jgi:hypothetical protein